MVHIGYEEDEIYQEKVRNTYLDIAERENWITINCCKEKDGNFEFFSPEEIHEKILEKLKDRNIL